MDIYYMRCDILSSRAAQCHAEYIGPFHFTSFCFHFIIQLTEFKYPLKKKMLAAMYNREIHVFSCRAQHPGHKIDFKMCKF